MLHWLTSPSANTGSSNLSWRRYKERVEEIIHCVRDDEETRCHVITLTTPTIQTGMLVTESEPSMIKRVSSFEVGRKRRRGKGEINQSLCSPFLLKETCEKCFLQSN